MRYYTPPAPGKALPASYKVLMGAGAEAVKALGLSFALASLYTFFAPLIDPVFAVDQVTTCNLVIAAVPDVCTPGPLHQQLLAMNADGTAEQQAAAVKEAVAQQSSRALSAPGAAAALQETVGALATARVFKVPNDTRYEPLTTLQLGKVAEKLVEMNAHYSDVVTKDALFLPGGDCQERGHAYHGRAPYRDALLASFTAAVQDPTSSVATSAGVPLPIQCITPGDEHPVVYVALLAADCRKGGLGAMVMETLVDVADAIGATLVLSAVTLDLQPLNFYSRFGLVMVQCNKSPLVLEEVDGNNAILMARAANPARFKQELVISPGGQPRLARLVRLRDQSTALCNQGYNRVRCPNSSITRALAPNWAESTYLTFNQRLMRTLGLAQEFNASRQQPPGPVTFRLITDRPAGEHVTLHAIGTVFDRISAPYVRGVGAKRKAEDAVAAAAVRVTRARIEPAAERVVAAEATPPATLRHSFVLQEVAALLGDDWGMEEEEVDATFPSPSRPAPAATTLVPSDLVEAPAAAAGSLAQLVAQGWVHLLSSREEGQVLQAAKKLARWEVEAPTRVSHLLLWGAWDGCLAALGNHPTAAVVVNEVVYVLAQLDQRPTQVEAACIMRAALGLRTELAYPHLLSRALLLAEKALR